jgi:hypothetical protein
MSDYNKIRRLPRQFKLGKYYAIWYSPFGKPRICKFIQPTKCGFNFLDLNTNKCILKQHIYPSKCKDHESGDWFWVSIRLITTEF